MKFTLTIFILCLTLIFGTAKIAFAEDDTSKANRLFVEAVQLIQLSENSISDAKKLELIEKALGIISNIIENYPSSDLAVKLITNEPIGNININEVRASVENIRNKAAIEICYSVPTPQCIFLIALAEVRKLAPSDRSDGLTSIANAQARLGDFKAAIATAKMIEDADWRSSTLSSIVQYQAEAGKITDAIENSNLIESIYDGSYALLAIGKALAIGGDLEKANFYYIVAIEMAKSSNNLANIPCMVSLAKIETLWVDIKVLDDLKKVAKETHDDAVGSCPDLGFYYDEMSEKFAKMSEKFAKNGDTKGALELLSLGQHSGNHLNATIRFAEFLADLDDVEGAQSLINSALWMVQEKEDTYERMKALSNIAKVQAKIGDFGSADFTIAMFENDDEWGKITTDTLATIAGIKAHKGQIKAAFDTLTKIEQMVEQKVGTKLGYGWIRSRALANIAEAQANAGDNKTAKETFDTAIKLAMQFDPAAGSGSTFIDIAEAQARTGDIRAALDTTKKMTEIGYSYHVTNALVQIAEVQAKAR